MIRVMKFKNIFVSLTVAFATVVTLTSSSVYAAGSVEHPKQLTWPFEGVLGKVDKQAAQRGYQVYKQVCAACHAMSGKSFRNLADIGFSEAEIKAIASGYNVQDGPNESGEMFERPARMSDRFVSPYPNENAARAANGGAYPPDLTLMVKARPDGANYLYSLLTGYKDAPADFPLTEGKYYNPYFAGGQIAMAPPLMDGVVTYQDGTPATPEQMAKDVTVFLQWAAEPEMEARKQMGLKVMIFLFITAVLSYIAMKRVWKDVK